VSGNTFDLMDEWAAVGSFHGANAGILGDPTSPDKEGILRAFARVLREVVPEEYVFGLDMGLTERDAAVFADELGDRDAAVGLRRALGGLPYDELGATVAIQGFGAVGQAAAERFVEASSGAYPRRTPEVQSVHSQSSLALHPRRSADVEDETGAIRNEKVRGSNLAFGRRLDEPK
jgi:hypothetical protein